MKTFQKVFLFSFICFNLKAQENILKTEFAVRDFTVKTDSIFLIEKRDVKYFSLKNSASSDNAYFIGGYGLKLYDDSYNNELITIANEFQKPVTSLRFYNKKTKIIDQVFYYQEGKSIDALLLPKLKFAVITLSNKKIIIVDYSKKPTFNIVDTISLKAISRTIIYNNNSLWYATDLGEIFKYDLANKQKTLVHNCGEIITNLQFIANHIIYSTIKGEIVKYNIQSKQIQKCILRDNFVLNSLKYQDNKLIFGTFKGLILLLNTDNLSIEKQFNYHNRSILNIVKDNNNQFYSSSIDKTIKKWKIN